MRGRMLIRRVRSVEQVSDCWRPVSILGGQGMPTFTAQDMPLFHQARHLV
jgi:hypothetical protein